MLNYNDLPYWNFMQNVLLFSFSLSFMLPIVINQVKKGLSVLSKAVKRQDRNASSVIHSRFVFVFTCINNNQTHNRLYTELTQRSIFHFFHSQSLNMKFITTTLVSLLSFVSAHTPKNLGDSKNYNAINLNGDTIGDIKITQGHEGIVIRSNINQSCLRYTLIHQVYHIHHDTIVESKLKYTYTVQQGVSKCICTHTLQIKDFLQNTLRKYTFYRYS